MANKKAKKDNKGAIIGICSAIVVLVVVIVAVVLATGGVNGGLNDSYFVSDDTKYVLTAEADEMYGDETNDEHIPIRTHVVYTYSGDDITGMTTYAEYADNAAAKAALDAMAEAGEDVTGIEVNGKYLVMVMDESAYEGVTAGDVKQVIELREALKNMDFNDTDDVEDVDDVEVIEATEDEEE